MTVQYQGVWSLQSAAQLQSTQRWVTDPLFENTTLLLQADDAANGAQNNTFLDSSSNSLAIARAGNATQGSFTPFSQAPGTWSAFFPGASSLIVPAGLAFAYGTGAFTVEAWINPYTYQAGSSTGGQIITQTTSGQNYFAVQVGAAGELNFTFGSGAGTSISTASGSIPIGRWTHIAVVREGTGAGQLKLYVNGFLLQSGICSFDFTDTTYNPTVGNYTHNSTQLPFGGYISNLRVVKGVAVYTGNFSPSSLPLTATQSAGINTAAITGTQTSLLTAQSNRFLDNSVANAGGGWTVTLGGTPSVQTFSPFAPQFQWTPSVIGGSGYFDGTGDNIQTSGSSANLSIGTGDFTLECWAYLISSAGDPGIMQLAGSPFGTNQPTYTNSVGILAITGTGLWSLINNNGFTQGSISARVNAWTHLAVCRSGTTHRLFVNGVQAASVSDSSNYSTLYFAAGCAYGTNFPSNSYISNVRFVRGTAVYTGAFTPPTRPLSASGADSASAYPSTTNVNTSFAASATNLLLNFSNAGIYDGTMKNNLETLGNAQVSTAVVKYGSGSLAFDGSGDYLSCPAANAGMNPQTGDFTIECWVWIPSLPGAEQAIVSTMTTGGSGVLLGLAGGGNVNRIQFGIGNLSVSNPTVVDTTTFPVRTWTHVAAVRRAGVLYLYKDGVSIGTPTTAAGSISQATLTVGAWSTGSAAFNGYLDDVRITAGIARYTQNFIPPSVALPRQ